MECKNLLKPLTQLVVGIIVLVYLLQAAGIADVLGHIWKIDPWYTLVAALAIIVTSILTGYMLFVSLKATGINPSLFNTFMASFGGQLASDVTPARTGYFVTPLLLNDSEGISIESGTASVVLTGVVNSFVKVALAFVALIYFLGHAAFNVKIVNVLLVGALPLLLGGLALLALIAVRRTWFLVRKFGNMPLVGKLLGGVTEPFERFQEEGRKMGKAAFLMALLVALSTFVFGIALNFIGLSLGITQPTAVDYIFIAPLGIACMYVPVTVAGLGVQEGAYVILLTALGVPFSQSVVFALIVRLLFTGTDMIGLPALLGTALKPSLRGLKARLSRNHKPDGGENV